MSVPVVGRRVDFNVSEFDRAVRLLPVASIMAQRVLSIVSPGYILLRYRYEDLALGSVNRSNIHDYINRYCYFMCYPPDDLTVDYKKVEERMARINKRLGYEVISHSQLNLTEYYQEKYFFNAEAFVSKELFTEIHQHFQNLQDTNVVSYALEGDLAGMDEILTRENFRGDPLMSAIKAKVYLETLMMQQEQEQQEGGSGSADQGEPDEEGKGAGAAADMDDGEDKGQPSFIQAVRDAHHEKEVRDKRYPYQKQKALEDNDIQAPDLFEQRTVADFAKDKGMITDKKIDLSFDSIYKREEVRDRNGHMRYIPNKEYNLKGVPKSSLAHPLFKSKHASRRLMKRDYFKKITKNEVVVFILCDVSGSMNTTGKLRVRNAIFMDRFEAVMKNRCQLYIQAYLESAIDDPKHINNADALTSWTTLRPNGGDTDVQRAVKETIKSKVFKSYLDKGIKGEIIIINDGQDSMPPFTAPEGVRIHAMQLADVGHEHDESKYRNEDLVQIAEMNNGKYMFIDTYRKD